MSFEAPLDTVQLLVTRGKELQRWAFPSENPLQIITFKTLGSGGDVTLSHALTGLFWAAFHRTECFLIGKDFSLVGSYISTCFHDCRFPDERGNFFAYTERESDTYTTRIHQLVSAAAELVELRLVSRTPKPPAKFLAISENRAAHLFEASKLAVYSVSGKDFHDAGIIETECVISDFAVTKEEVIVLSNDNATVRIFRQSNATWTLKLNRVFNNVQELKLHLEGPILLIQAHRFSDKNNSSYYGIEKLFYRELQKGALEPVHTHHGAIHDCQLNHARTQFVVISGKMPSHSVIYDAQCRPFYLLNNGFRNYARFSPDDRLLALAGLGSLNGDIDIFCAQSYRRVGACTSSHASFLKWSPDSRFFLTAIVFKKLKVDHSVSLYTFDCRLVKRVKLAVFDLIDVDFLSVPTAPPPELAFLAEKEEKQGLLSANLEKPHRLSPEEVQSLGEVRRVQKASEQAGGQEEVPAAEKKPSKPKKEIVLTRKRD